MYFRNTNNHIQLDVSSVVEVLTKQLSYKAMQTRIAALRWIYHLHINTPNKVVSSEIVGYFRLACIIFKQNIYSIYKFMECDQLYIFLLHT